MANANFPGSVWDGSSKTRKQTLDKEPPLQVYRSPDPDDWAQIAAEMVAPPGAMTRQTTRSTSTTAVGRPPSPLPNQLR